MSELPSVSEIVALTKSLEHYWAERLKLDEEEQDFINGTHMIETPDTRVLGLDPEAITLGIGAETVRHIKGLFPYGEYVVAPQGLGDKPKRDAEKVAAFLNAVTQALEDDGCEDTRDLRDDDAISHGRACTVTLPIFKRYSREYGHPVQTDGETDKEFNKRVAVWRQTARIPISHRHYPINQCLPLVSGKYGVVKAVIKSEEVGSDIADQWPKSQFAQSIKPEDKAKKWTILLYLDEFWCAYIWGGKEGSGIGPVHWGNQAGEVLDSWQHKMGVCPLNLTVGELTPDPRPAYRYKSRIYDLMPLGKARDRLASRQLTAVKVQALVPPVLKTKEVYGAGTESPNRVIEFHHDGVPTSLFADEELLQPLNYPLQAEGESLDLKLREQIQRHSYTDVIAGIGGGDQSGIQFLYRSKAAQNVFTPLGQHLADGTRRDGQMILRAVIALGEPVDVRKSNAEGVETVGVTPELAQRFLEDVHVDRTPTFPEDEGRDLENVGKAISLGYPEPRAWQRFGHETEPEKLFEEKLVWQWLSEAGAAAMTQEALMRADLLAQEAETMNPAELAGVMPQLPLGLQQALMQPPQMPVEGAMAGAPPAAMPAGVPPMGTPV